jgi:hypothetical protein
VGEIAKKEAAAEQQSRILTVTPRDKELILTYPKAWEELGIPEDRFDSDKLTSIVGNPTGFYTAVNWKGIKWQDFGYTVFEDRQRVFAGKMLNFAASSDGNLCAEALDNRILKQVTNNRYNLAALAQIPDDARRNVDFAVRNTLNIYLKQWFDQLRPAFDASRQHSDEQTAMAVFYEQMNSTVAKGTHKQIAVPKYSAPAVQRSPPVYQTVSQQPQLQLA